jgi:HTH-type transcriptional regulator/antitoxin HigA
LATQKRIKVPFDRMAINDDFIGNLRALSRHAEGPRLAVSLLEQYGIVVVIEAHLKGTHLDGAAFKLPGGTPVIALTLRYDRLDNFWFCLLHELAHVVRHLYSDGASEFFDNLETKVDPAKVNPIESEADQCATDGLISPTEWANFSNIGNVTAKEVQDCARRLVVHPAIVAGRIRRETGNYRIFARFVGQGKVRILFPEWRTLTRRNS